MVIFFGLLLWAELSKPKPVDWTETYNKSDKIPYGGYITFEELKKVNGDKPIHSQKMSPYLYLDEAEAITGGQSSLVIIQSGGMIDEYEWEKMEEYAGRGNTVFISSGYFNSDVLDSMGLEVLSYSKAFDTSTIHYSRLVNPAFRNATFRQKRTGEVTYFSVKENAGKIKILGVTHDTLVNFVEYSTGSGKIYLHANPAAFGNMDVLAGDNYKYSFGCLSYLPQVPVLWDEHYKRGNATKLPETGTPLRYILQQPAFKWAFNVLWIGLLVFALFRMKRMQRAIPVVKPLENTSLEFAETMGRLYFNRGNNRDIAYKKINYFNNHLLEKYNLKYRDDDPGFAGQLAGKTGIREQDATKLLSLIKFARSKAILSGDELLQLNNKIDEFYANAK
ncbi:MAG TPA: DUF4350 domain-containing protein [Bacteroidia bacterium]|nr:DUF4350 domain-containing protein [Bacteroidia bacterium]